jgi:hypothetical protein
VSTQRRPRGYVGKDHVTIGSDICALLAILKLPEQVLGADETEKLRRVAPDGWYPISWLLELLEKLDERVGYYGLLRMGRTLFKMSHEARVRQFAKSARDILYGLDDMYHHANRGTSIGGWRVVKFEPGYAEIENTTPQHCVMEQGILTEALSLVGCPGMVSQRECFRRRADSCLFTVTSALTDARWG